MTNYILYIPGLGDGYDSFRQRALRFWALYSVNARLVPMNWYGIETYDDQFQRSSDIILSLAKNGARISLVGESAGASMAINLFAAHPEITSLVTIAGVNQATTPVAPRTLRKGPSFEESRRRVGDSLVMLSQARRRNIHTVSALFDSVVMARYSRMNGANNHRILAIGHFMTIAICLTVYSWYIIYLTRKTTSV
jgi:pimeloyl-ACP methyl ester carboxylesterase